MTGFAGHTGFRPAAGISFSVGIVIFPEVGAVALDAAAVGILKMPRPVQWILGIDGLVGLQVKPFLTGLGGGSAVPGQVQCLQSSSARFSQVLLQRVVAERVTNVEFTRFAIATAGCDPKAAILSKKSGFRRRGTRPSHGRNFRVR